MKNLAESLRKNERTISYSVAFLGFVDEDGLPISVEIEVPAKYKKEFEHYIEKELDNTIEHAASYDSRFEV